jgi:hypothetical protein
MSKSVDLYQFEADSATLLLNENLAKIINLSKNCIAFFEDVLDYKLDHTINSLKYVDQYIENAFIDQESEVPKNLIDMFGSYFGETLRYNLKGRWYVTPEGTLLLKSTVGDNEITVFPYVKTHKRFLNGIEDSLYHYANYAYETLLKDYIETSCAMFDYIKDIYETYSIYVGINSKTSKSISEESFFDYIFMFVSRLSFTGGEWSDDKFFIIRDFLGNKLKNELFDFNMNNIIGKINNKSSLEVFLKFRPQIIKDIVKYDVNNGTCYSWNVAGGIYKIGEVVTSLRHSEDDASLAVFNAHFTFLTEFLQDSGVSMPSSE